MTATMSLGAICTCLSHRTLSNVVPVRVWGNGFPDLPPTCAVTMGCTRCSAAGLYLLYPVHVRHAVSRSLFVVADGKKVLSIIIWILQLPRRLDNIVQACVIGFRYEL